ncbi:GNAT family N-acetyltransferase, partial [Rhizobium sp. BR5]
MRDLSDFKGCPAPQPVVLKGRYVTAEPFGR